MGWESCGVVGFDLGPLLQGQTMVHWLWLVVFPVDRNLHQFKMQLVIPPMKRNQAVYANLQKRLERLVKDFIENKKELSRPSYNV